VADVAGAPDLADVAGAPDLADVAEAADVAKLAEAPDVAVGRPPLLSAARGERTPGGWRGINGPFDMTVLILDFYLASGRRR